jgi:alpha-L-fucosidase
MAWFRESRFGMFIHWGLYAIPGGEWNGKYYGGATEWLMDSAKIVPADWEPLKPRFNPAEFDAKKIVSAAKSAGMKYIVITSKHHEGFAMYPSQFGNWDIGDTPFKRDPLRELSEECQRQGIKFCTYYSIMDWHHPDYLPRRPWDKRPAAQAKFDRYVSTMKAQLKEIVTRYKPAIMWFDGEWEKTWNHDRGFDLYNYCRSLKPDMIVNNRVDVGRAGMGGFSGAASMGDYGTPEQEIPANGVQGDWESCMTMNNSWGFAKQDSSWKSTATLISNLVDCASKGGNYLLNVGPDELGRIPEPSLERLSEIGGWLLNSQQAIYGTTASPFPKSLPWGKVTRRGNTLYCIVTDSGAAHPELTGLKTSIVSAKTLDGAKIRIDTANEWPTLNIGTNASANGRAINPMVVAVELSGPPEVVKVVQGAQADGSFMLKAQDAIFSSPIRFENDKNSLGFWTDLAATVTWEFKCAKEGTYNLELELACENSSAGATVELFVNDQKRTLVVEGTGAWSTFKKVNLGTIRLTAANQKLLVRPLQMPGGAVMNLRGIKISPVRS